MRLFISWAKDSAKEVALALHDLLPKATLNHVRTWCSADPACLPQGPGFYSKILSEAKNCDACLVILTRENLSSWWVNFEPGIFFGQDKKVFALLCGDLTHSELGTHGHPIAAAAVNCTYMTLDHLANLLISLKSDDQEWMRQDFKQYLTVHFDDLKKRYDAIFDNNYAKLSNLLSCDINNTSDDIAI